MCPNNLRSSRVSTRWRVGSIGYPIFSTSGQISIEPSSGLVAAAPHNAAPMERCRTLVPIGLALDGTWSWISHDHPRDRVSLVGVLCRVGPGGHLVGDRLRGGWVRSY